MDPRMNVENFQSVQNLSHVNSLDASLDSLHHHHHPQQQS